MKKEGGDGEDLSRGTRLAVKEGVGPARQPERWGGARGGELGRGVCWAGCSTVGHSAKKGGEVHWRAASGERGFGPSSQEEGEERVLSFFSIFPSFIPKPFSKTNLKIIF